MMKRYTAIVIVIAALVFVYALTSLFLSPRRPDMREELASKFRALEKYQSLVNGADGIRAETGKIRAELDKLEKAVSPMTDESLAFARLQSEIQELAGDSGLVIVSMKTREPVKYSGFIGLPVEVEAKGGIEALSMMLKSLDDPSSFISVERLDVSRPGVRADEELRIKLNVTGLMRS